MSKKTPRRGFNPEDYRWFSPKALVKLSIAQEEIQWLLDRGYPLDSVMDLVGGHHQLSTRQRTALQRATSSSRQCKKRQATLQPLEAAHDGCLNIDGFNLIITLEVAISGGILIRGNDGVLRDLAGLRGTYSIIEQTDAVLELLGAALARLAVPEIKFFLDAPVSNSGKLRNRILAHAVHWKIPVVVELVPNADAVLAKGNRIVTSDSVLLDQCQSWFDLSSNIIANQITTAWIISFEHPFDLHSPG